MSSRVPGGDGFRPDGLAEHSDESRRCGWATGVPADYAAYHDREWGHPVRGVAAMFERISLEGFQSGLSWLTVLRKRPAFRVAFAGFDPAVVAGFGDTEIAALLTDSGIIRHRGKIEATVHNARVVCTLDTALDELVWSFAPPSGSQPRPVSSAEVMTRSPESAALAAELKRRGLRFVGPTTCFALMEAAGLIDNHETGCWRAAPDPAPSQPATVGAAIISRAQSVRVSCAPTVSRASRSSRVRLRSRPPA